MKIFVCVPFTKFSFSGKDALAKSFGLTNGEMELGRAGLTPDSQVDLGVVTTPDTSLERDVVSCVVALGEEIDTLVTADECSVIEELLAVDTSSRMACLCSLSHWLMMNLFQAYLQATVGFLHMKTFQCLQ